MATAALAGIVATDLGGMKYEMPLRLTVAPVLVSERADEKGISVVSNRDHGPANVARMVDGAKACNWDLSNLAEDERSGMCKHMALLI